jgi:hypothetical protein
MARPAVGKACPGRSPDFLLQLRSLEMMGRVGEEEITETTHFTQTLLYLSNQPPWHKANKTSCR